MWSLWNLQFHQLQPQNNLYVMKFLKPFYQLKLILNSAHVVPEDDIFIQKHFGIFLLLSYWYNNVHLGGCNKNILIINTRSKQYELKMYIYIYIKGKKYGECFETGHSFSSFIVEIRPMTIMKVISIMASGNLVCVIQSK